MKTFALSLLALLALGSAAHAQRMPVELGPRVSIELRDSHLAIGAEARFGVAYLAPSVRLDIRPEFNYYLYSGGHIFDLSGDLLFAFDVHNDAVEPYAGIGIGLFNIGCDGCDGFSRVGLNILGGAKFALRGTVQPFVEIRFTFGDIDPVLLTGGVLFIL